MLQMRQDISTRHDFVHRPLGSPAHVHIFNESDLGLDPLAILDQINEFVLVGTANDHRVELQASETDLLRGLNAL
jgi:hypothetical protein